MIEMVLHLHRVLYGSLIVFINLHYIFSGSVISKCAPINTHVELDCGDHAIIYIRQTTISDYYSLPSPSDICYLPPMNRYCHAYTNSTDIQYNGRHRANHLFTSGRLSYYGSVFGECKSNSTSKVVQIQYECLSESERPSVCSNIDIIGNSDGFLMNPEFPDPVDRAYEKCDCHLAATEMGIIKLVAILINPIYTQEDVDGWELSLKLAGGEIVPLDKMHRYTAEIEMPFVGSLDIRYRSYGDSTNLPTLIPTLPPGFWIQYKVFPETSRLNVKCVLKNDNEDSNITIGMLAAVSGTCGVFVVFVMTVICFLIKMKRKKTESKSRQQQSFGVINEGADIDFSPLPHQTNLTHSSNRSDFDIRYLGDDGSVYFRRCNTLPDLQLSKYSSLPRSFSLAEHNIRYAMTDVDSDFGMSSGFGPEINFSTTNTLPSKGRVRGRQNRHIANGKASSEIAGPVWASTPKVENCYNEPTGSVNYDADSDSFGSYALSCTTLGLNGYDCFHTVNGVTDDAVDV